MVRFFSFTRKSTTTESVSPKKSKYEITKAILKWVAYITATAVVAWFFYQVFEDGKIADSKGGDSDKIVEISHTTITGYRDLSLAWQMLADHIWTGRNQYLFRGELVKNGSVYDSTGKLIIGDISAKGVMVNSRTRTVTVEGGVLATLFRRNGNNKDPIRIDAGDLRYYEISSKAYLSNHVILKNSSAEAVANDVAIDTETNTAEITGAFQVTANEFLVKSDDMKIFIDDGAAELNQNVKGFRKGTLILNRGMDERERIIKSLDTVLRADFLRFQEVSGNKVVRIQGNIKFEQPDKFLMGDIATYDKNLDEFTIQGNVKLTANNLIWAFRASQLASMSNKEIKEAITDSISIESEKLVFYAGNKKSFRIGPNVRINLPGKLLVCQFVDYDDKTQQLTFSGGVRIVKNGSETLSANRLILDLKNETFSADDRIVGEFDIDRKPAAKNSGAQ